MMGVPTFRRLTFRRRDTSSTKQKYDISSTKPKTTLRRRSQKRHFVDATFRRVEFRRIFKLMFSMPLNLVTIATNTP
uniref:Uncharacterized protein n=1 Tax=Globodera rostochiensis TaxID=31243 RepID=A0A914H8H9_GLORO